MTNLTTSGADTLPGRVRASADKMNTWYYSDAPRCLSECPCGAIHMVPEAI